MSEAKACGTRFTAKSCLGESQLKKRAVIDTANLPFRLPVNTSWLMALSQHVWTIPGWALGIAWFVIFWLWVIAVIDIFIREEHDLFEKK